MLQAATLDCQFFDPLPFSDDGFFSPEVDQKVSAPEDGHGYV